MEGFLSLEQAAEQLGFAVSELSRQIEQGRVVAIVKEGRSWLSAGEVSRLKRQSERASHPPAEPEGELRLLRRSTAEAVRTPASDLPERPLLSLAPREVMKTESPPELPIRPLLSFAPQQSSVPEPVPLDDGASDLFPTFPEDEPPALPAEPVAAVETPIFSPPAVADPVMEPAPAAAPTPVPDEKTAQQIRELNKRCAELENRNLELETVGNRLKSGLQETEATLKRNRAARTNLENDVIGLQDQLGKAKARNEALEREIQHLGSELERIEDSHNSELRRLRSKSDRSGDERDREQAPTSSGPGNTAELEALRNHMAEKDRLLAQEYEQRATLRSQLEDKQQKYFELKARYDKEKSEWSELLAQALQNQGQLRAQLEEMKARNPKGWNPFRREK